MPQLTDTQIKGAHPGTTLWDASLKGFGVRCLKSRKTFIVLIASGRRQALGHYGPGGLTLSEARTEAKKLLANKTLGKIRPKHIAFDDARDEFLKAREDTIRSRTLADYRRLLTKHFPYGRTSLSAVTPRSILSRLNKLPRAEKHHAFAAGRAFFKFCVSQQYVERSPMADMEAPAASKPRERALTNQELGARCRLVFAPQDAFQRIIALCILTGQRRGEIARFERSWLKDDVLTIPSHVTKIGRTHAFPVGRRAKTILDGAPTISTVYYFPAARDRTKGKPATVFNGWGKPKAALDARLGEAVAPWVSGLLVRRGGGGLAAGTAQRETHRPSRKGGQIRRVVGRAGGTPALFLCIYPYGGRAYRYIPTIHLPYARRHRAVSLQIPHHNGIGYRLGPTRRLLPQMPSLLVYRLRDGRRRAGSMR